ncbi:hypothetical protein D1007_32511 [Hordeum vulgare]|nr:hypothetical protein D1007_32511 [Hordeum vulgare]
MKFTSYDRAWYLYNTYARYAGFDTCKKSKHKTNAYIVCSREGTHKESVANYDRKHNKTSKRIGYEAGIRIQKRKNGTFGTQRVELNHNHKMLESPGMLLHMHSYKRDDPLFDQLVKDMQMDNHTHAQMMATLSRLSGGRQFMGHTSREWVNKKQKFAREESEDDVKKLLELFEKMKKTNREFFYDYNVDADKRVKNIFWSDASCT